jgi:hypothetical protein
LSDEGPGDRLQLGSARRMPSRPWRSVYDQVEPSVECTRRSGIADFAAGTTAAIETDRLLRNLLRTTTTSSPVASYISTRPPSSSALTRARLVLKLSVCDEKYGSETSTTVLRVSS